MAQRPAGLRRSADLARERRRIGLGDALGLRRELDDAAMANTLVVDSRDAVLKESGDVILSKARICAEVGEIFAGLKPPPARGTTIFKSVGLAVEDIATARLVYDAARAAGRV